MAPRLPIFSMFGPSPLRPLETHMEKTHECTQTLKSFFEAILKLQWNEGLELYNKIAKLENEADSLKKDLRLHLPKDLFLPVPRTDLLTMLTLQDRIANKAKDIAGLAIGRRMQFPQAVAPIYMEFLQRCLDAENQAFKAINELDELLEAGFRGREAKLVEEMIIELDKIEHDTDEKQILVRRKLFEIETELPPVEVVFLYKIIDWTGELADRAQAVGGQLELLLAH